MAEQFATRDFQDTVLFEPFGGDFGITRTGAGLHGWSCSQPLDLLDGYDILSRAGRRLVWNVLVTHRPYLVILAFPCGLWSILANLLPGKDWEALRKILGKRTLRFVYGICRFQHARGRRYLGAQFGVWLYSMLKAGYVRSLMLSIPGYAWEMLLAQRCLTFFRFAASFAIPALF